MCCTAGYLDGYITWICGEPVIRSLKKNILKFIMSTFPQVKSSVSTIIELASLEQYLLSPSFSCIPYVLYRINFPAHGSNVVWCLSWCD